MGKSKIVSRILIAVPNPFGLGNSGRSNTMAKAGFPL